MTVPRVSVGLPVFNGSPHLARAIDSILGQSFTDLELVVSDNGSTDDTAEICRSFASKDRRVRYFCNPENIGAARNYNIVFSHARGEYFKWASASDVCEPSFIAKCAAVLDSRRDVVLVCPHTRYFKDDATVGEEQSFELASESACARFIEFLRRVRLNNMLNGLIRAEALGHTGMHKIFRGSDVNLVAELTLYGKFAVVPELLFNRRMDDASASSFRSDAEIEEMFEPTRTRPLIFQHWKEDFEYFAALWRARLPLRERACLYRYLFRYLIRDRDDLAADLLQAGRRVLGPMPSNRAERR